MNHEKLNSLVVTYQSSPTEDNFRNIYDKVTELWEKRKVINALSHTYRLNYVDVYGVALAKLYSVASKYDATKGDFYKLLSVSIKSGCLDFIRKEKRHYGNVPLESDHEDDYSIADYLPCANAEDEAIENLQKKSDQRQLIAILIDKAPEKCRQAVEAFVQSNFSYPDAAKHLGISYPTVKRRVEAVSRYFDANQNGDIYDYFTVVTEQKLAV